MSENTIEIENKEFSFTEEEIISSLAAFYEAGIKMDNFISLFQAEELVNSDMFKNKFKIKFKIK